MTTPPQVRPGQVWADNDPRQQGVHTRYLYVDALPLTDKAGRPVKEPTHALCCRAFRVAGTTGRWNVRCDRPTRIALRRFRPTANGYRLIQDVEP